MANEYDIHITTTMVLVMSCRSVVPRLCRVGRWKNVLESPEALFLGRHKLLQRVQHNIGSRRPLSTMSPHSRFCLNDYDAIGFDLDNTVVRYRVANMVQMEYNVLVEFLTQEKGYSPKYLTQPLHEDEDWLQKGLVVDFARGNLLRMNRQGVVLQASHGRRLLTKEELKSVYGEECQWSVGKSFAENILGAWNGPMSEKLRNLLDYFDMPSSVIFARIVDTLDEENGGQPLPLYNIWPDILAGLMHIYSREHFDGKSNYFQAMKCNPERFVYEVRPEVVEWLRELRKTKSTFILTGSHKDFADFTSSYALAGQAKWEELFDVIVCFARKPGFFTENRPFVKLEGDMEAGVITDKEELRLETQFYSQGNTKDLLHMLQQKTGLADPKVLYVGDNLIQDVYTPSAMAKWDTVAVVEELLAEQRLPEDKLKIDLDGKLLGASQWGSYFKAGQEDSFWYDVMKEHSKICVPSLETLAENPIDHVYKAFGKDSHGKYPPHCDGFHF